MLSSLVTGEAMTVFPNGGVWEAWSRSFKRFDPKISAKALMSMISVMNPKGGLGVPAQLVLHEVNLDDQNKVALLTPLLRRTCRTLCSTGRTASANSSR